MYSIGDLRLIKNLKKKKKENPKNGAETVPSITESTTT